MQNVLAGRFLIGKEKYTINCPVKQKKPQVKQMGKQSVKMIVIKWKKMYDFYAIVSIN